MKSLLYQKINIISTEKLKYLLIYLFLFIFFFFLIYPCKILYDQDSYYHAKISELIIKLIYTSEFPWMTSSIYCNNYADKNIVFHLLLYPCIVVGGINGALLFCIGLSSLIFLTFYIILEKYQVNYPLMWLILLISSTEDFLLRFIMIRPHLLSILFVIVFVISMMHGYKIYIFFLSLLYPFIYISFHLLIFLSLVYIITEYIISRKWNDNLLFITMSGMIVGLLLHPDFPRIVYLWKINCLDLFINIWMGRFQNDIIELLPLDARYLYNELLVPFFLFICAFINIIVKGNNLDKRIIGWFFIAASFNMLTIISIRFMEYSLFFNYFFVAMALSDRVRQLIECNRIFIKNLIILIFFIYISHTLTLNYLQGRMKIQSNNFNMEQIGSWMKQNIGDGSIVFHYRWDIFPQLFYYNDNNRYIIGLDPFFMYKYDAELYNFYTGLILNSYDDPIKIIKEKFHAKYVLLLKGYDEIFYSKIKNKVVLIYNDNNSLLFRIQD